MTGQGVVTIVGWRLVRLLSRSLEPAERDAIFGEFIESRSTSGQALRDVLGLVVRRQIGLWTDWKPWGALLGIVAPLGLLLSYVSIVWADSSAVYAWLYVNNWTPGFFEIPGARRDLLNTSTRFCLNAITFVGWSWSAGFVLGTLSRRVSWVTGSLFCAFVLGSNLGTETSASTNPHAASIFSEMFYSVAWPVILQTLLIVAPALAGLRKARHTLALPLGYAMPWAVVVTLLTARAAFSLEGSVLLGGGLLLPARRELGLVPLAIVWPVCYIVTMAYWQRWHRKAVDAHDFS